MWLLNKHKINRFDTLNWQSIWAKTCYFLWFWRNKYIHDPHFIRPFRPWQVLINHCTSYCHANSLIPIPTRGINFTAHIKWNPPPNGWVCINSDGFIDFTSSLATCGGLCRDHNVNWLGGFAKKIGISSPFVAELWGVFEALSLAHVGGVVRAQLQVDSLSIVKILNGKGSDIANLAIGTLSKLLRKCCIVIVG